MWTKAQTEARNQGGAPARTEEVLSLEALFRRHVGDVHRFVARLLGPGAIESDIEDLTQRVFIDAGKGLSSFRGESKPSTWLYRIASRVVLAHLQTRRRHRALLARLDARTETSSADPTEGAEARLAKRQELQQIWRCLMRIKPKKRVVFLMHRVEGKSGKEIAEILQIKEATVWTRLHHARTELLEHLAKLRAQEEQ